MDPTGRSQKNPWQHPTSAAAPLVFHGPAIISTVVHRAMWGKSLDSEAPFLQDAFQIDPIEEHVLEVDVDDLMAVGALGAAGAGGESFLDKKKKHAMPCNAKIPLC